MTREDIIENYKYDRAIDLIRRIKTEETREREIDRHKAFDLAISTLEKQIPKKPNVYNKFERHCERGAIVKTYQNYCNDCGQALDWSE